MIRSTFSDEKTCTSEKPEFFFFFFNPVAKTAHKNTFGN
jgi:hypothetical protein